MNGGGGPSGGWKCSHAAKPKYYVRVILAARPGESSNAEASQVYKSCAFQVVERDISMAMS